MARTNVRKVASASLTGLAGVALLAAVVLTGQSYLNAEGAPTWHPLHDEMGLARAAAFTMVGPGAIEGAEDPSLWYVTGASVWYVARPRPAHHNDADPA